MYVCMFVCRPTTVRMYVNMYLIICMYVMYVGMYLCMFMVDQSIALWKSAYAHVPNCLTKFMPNRL